MDKSDHLNQQACTGVGALVQALMIQVAPNGVAASHIALSGCLGALLPGAILMAKTDNDRVQLQGTEQMKYITHELLTFVGLVVADMYMEYDLKTGGLTTGFGPFVFAKALTEWEKIYPDKKAEDYIDESLIKGARAEREKGPEHNFWKKARPGFFLPNNGTIN